MDATLSVETYMGSPGSWELVAQLDPVTSFLLLVQPVLTDGARRTQVQGDLRTLASRMQASFWKDGHFWGTTGGIDRWGSRHSDFGHILKAYFALLQIDKRLDDHPLQGFLEAHAATTLTRAHDPMYGRWAKAPTSPDSVEYGSDWWAYAEADQLAATLALADPAWIPVVAASSTHFREDYVDRERPAREVVPSITRGGAWVRAWTDRETAKAGEWKNGFHAAEHALIMTLLGHYLEGTPATLYFALPADRVEALARVSTPYTFLGRVAAVEDLRPLATDPTRRVVRVSFDRLR
jgi:hypothetical protein